MESNICLVIFIYIRIIICLGCEKDICLFSTPNRANFQDQQSMHFQDQPSMELEHLDKFIEACKFFVGYSSAMKFALHSRPMYHRIMWSKLLMKHLTLWFLMVNNHPCNRGCVLNVLWVIKDWVNEYVYNGEYLEIWSSIMK